MVAISVGQTGVDPRHAFPDPATREPQRLQRRGELQRAISATGFQAPRECRAQIVDLQFGLFDAALIAAHRNFEERREGDVVIAVSRAHTFGFPGLAQLLQRVLPNRLKQSVSRWATGVFGDHERLLDEQAELIEDLVALYIGSPDAGYRVRGVEVEAAQEHRDPTKEDLFDFAQQRM